MTKNNFLPSCFKIITTALFGFVFLLPSSVVGGQNPLGIADGYGLQVRAKLNSGANIVITLPCDYYLASYYPNGQWNDMFTENGLKYVGGAVQPLTNMVSGGWAYPLKYPHECPPACSPTCKCIIVSAQDGNRFWDAYFTPRGFTRVSIAGIPGSGDPDLSKNCHGHSTGVGYWLDGFGTLMACDYHHFVTNIGWATSGLKNGDVYGTESHSGKIVSVTTTNPGTVELSSKITKNSEKMREPAIYEKTVNLTFNYNDYVYIEGNSGFFTKR